MQNLKDRMLEDQGQDIENLEELNKSLIYEVDKSKNELLEARKELIKVSLLAAYLFNQPIFEIILVICMNNCVLRK